MESQLAQVSLALLEFVQFTDNSVRVAPRGRETEAGVSFLSLFEYPFKYFFFAISIVNFEFHHFSQYSS